MPGRSTAVTARVRRYAHVLRALDRANNVVKSATVRAAKRELVLALVDVAKSIINRKIPLNANQLSAIRRHSSDIRSLVRPGQSIQGRKRILQKGGFLGMLLGPLLKTVVPSILGGLLGGGRR